MRRYRRLTLEELEAVRPEFVQFLASEGIAADDWEKKMSEGSPDVGVHLDEFSERFWDGATEAIMCLEHRLGEGSLWVFHFEKSTAHVIQCREQAGKVSWSQGHKNYPPEARGREIFLLLEQGSQPCSKDRFKEIYNQMLAVTLQD